MPKIKKVHRKKTYKVDINRKRLRNKLRKLPDITCPQIKEAWDTGKSTKSNLLQMGLGYDANHIFRIPNVKDELIKSAKRKASGELSDSDDEVDVKKRIPKKIQVAWDLEAEARAPRERMFRLPKGEVQFITYLMDKYNDDYEAMARDKKNYYQLTWRQIRQKINTFKKIPEQYAEYLVQKGEIVLDDPTTLAETKKKLGEENLKEHCVSKKPKKTPVVSQWLEEDIDDEDDTFETEKTLNDDEISGEKSSATEKKLKLFSDDEDEDESSENTKKVTKKNKKNQGKEKAKEVIELPSNDKKTTKKIEKNTPKIKPAELIERSPSSDSEDSEEFEGDDDETDFKDLADISDDEELSEDDILDDGEFVSDEDSD